MSMSIQQMADRVAELMEARLRVKGAGLEAKLRRGGRFLPRKVLASAQLLAVSSEQARMPRVRGQFDPEQIATAYDTCVRFLKPLGAGARRRAAIVGFVTSLAGIVIATAALVGGVLVWRGFL